MNPPLFLPSPTPSSPVSSATEVDMLEPSTTPSQSLDKEDDASEFDGSITLSDWDGLKFECKQPNVQAEQVCVETILVHRAFQNMSPPRKSYCEDQGLTYVIGTDVWDATAGRHHGGSRLSATKCR